MAERSRTEFARAVHPSNDAACGEVVGDALDERRLVEILDGLAVLSRRPREMLSVDGWTPERMVGHLAIRITEIDPVCVQRRADRAPRVAGRRRHEQPIESRLGEDACVCDAVERHAAAEAEIAQPRFAP
jgi:hypothetical protein